ncbi:hypothetical protein MtrunA17_Chr5g0433061 [Medicago truncatula]|uniref:Uncharacterized protein n=1 Tax=Medicago truncatula TaxID=3880 RepID=A0A396HW84_MEDTR|nr:hypothetical protein MtrunA17_Chr5g0433061 [Medicago truncatula]
MILSVGPTSFKWSQQNRGGESYRTSGGWRRKRVARGWPPTSKKVAATTRS